MTIQLSVVCQLFISLNMAEKFCLKWNDFTSNVSKSFERLRTADYLHDVTLVSDDHKQISAHKLVLSACSEYFRNIFQHNSKHAHPFLCLDGVSSADLENILDYIYNGEIKIYQDNLDRFLAVAQRFRLEGLLNDNSKTEDLDQNQHETESIFTPSEQLVAFEQEASSPPKNIQGIHDPMPITSSRELATTERMKIPLSTEELNDLKYKINQYLDKNEGSKLFRCTLCGKEAVRKEVIECHIENVHLEGISIPCSLCDQAFRSRNSMKIHKSRYHKKTANHHFLL